MNTGPIGPIGPTGPFPVKERRAPEMRPVEVYGNRVHWSCSHCMRRNVSRTQVAPGKLDRFACAKCRRVSWFKQDVVKGQGA